MTIAYRILGGPGEDNAVLVTADSGQKVTRFLLDCGEGCLDGLPPAEVAAIDAVLFSHLHLDHAAGFDFFLRRTYDRDSPPVRIWGPAGTAEAIHHHVLGFTWNLLGPSTPGEIRVTDVTEREVRTSRLFAREGFRVSRPEGSSPFDGTLWSDESFRVECRIVDHGTPCLAYSIVEKERTRIDAGRLAGLGLAPGKWCARLKDPAAPDDEPIEAGGRRFPLGELRAKLLEREPGSRISYATDLLIAGEAADRLLEMVRGSRTLVAECSYREADADLALRNYHLTTRQVGGLAARAGAGELVLIHVSFRYERPELAELLREVREVFPAARFPDGW